MGNQADRIRDIAAEMTDLVNEARNILRGGGGKLIYEHLNMYVFKQIEEHISKSNMGNKDLEDVAVAIEIIEEDEETQEFTENEDDESLLADDDPTYEQEKEAYQRSLLVDDKE